MSPPQSTTQESSTKQPNSKDPQPKGTTPPDGTSGKYRHSNIPQPTYFHDAMYVLSYDGRAWPAKLEQYDGIIGVYTSFVNAQGAGTRWLREQRALQSDGSDSTESRISEWKVNEKTGNWEKAKALSGPRFLQSHVVRIKRCEVTMDNSLPEKSKERDGKEKGGKDVDEMEEKSHGVDEQDDGKEKGECGVVEGIERLAV